MKKKRILIVDDEERFCRFVKIALEKTGSYEVGIETMARNSLETALTFKPDFVFMDVTMPGLDGGDVVAQFEEVPALRNVPVVFLTGAATHREVNRGGGMIGRREFLAKPVTIEDLKAAVERHIGSHAA